MKKVQRRRRLKRGPVEERPRERGECRPFSEQVGLVKKKATDERADT